MNPVRIEHLAKLCGVDAAWLGALLYRVNLPFEENGTFDPADLFEMLERSKHVPTIKPTEIAPPNIVTLRGAILPLLHSHKLRAKWKFGYGNQKNTIIHIPKDDGEVLAMAVRSSTKELSAYPFVLHAPYLDWYAFVLGSPDLVILKRADELSALVNWKDREELSISITEKDVSSYFVNQIEFLIQDVRGVKE